MMKNKKEVDTHVRTVFSKLPDNERKLRGFTVGKLYKNIGEFKSGLQHVNSYIEVKNDSAQAYRLQGECYEGLKQFDKAIKSYQQSIHLEPKQSDLLKHTCKLILAHEHIFSSGQAQQWIDLAAAQNCTDDAVMKLKLKMINRNNGGPTQARDVLLSEILTRPTDVTLRVHLIKHYLDHNQVADAFKYAYDLELKQNEFFAQSIDWYNAVSSVLAKCNKELRNKWSFWLLSIMTLERQCFLKLCASEVMKEQQILNLTECASFLFEFDQTLSAASSTVLTVCSERELAAQFLHHYRGQLCLHAATFLLKRDRIQQSQNRDTIINALALLLVAYNCGIASTDEPWLRNSTEATVQLIRLWSREGAFRCSQAGRTLLSCIDDDKQSNSVMANIRKICTDWTTSEELVNQLRRVSVSSDWRKNLFRMLFSGRDQASKSSSSHLLECSEMDNLNYELPKVSELDTYEECAQWLRPSSLAQMVYLCIGAADLSDITCQTFKDLKFSIPNLLQSGAETLNQLDIDTFLYAATIQAKRKLEIERSVTESQNKGKNFIKPKVWPFATVASMLASEEQANWWVSAYRVCRNISGEDFAEMRQQLQYGIEAVRGVNGPKMDPIISFKLGKVFSDRSKASTKVVEGGFLDARTLALFKIGLHTIKMQNSRNIEARLFKYANSQETEVDELAETAVVHLAQHYFETNDYEDCIDELSNISLPYATYFISKSYQKMEESSKTPRNMRRIYIDRANEYLQKTEALFGNSNSQHPLRNTVDSDIRRLQQHSSSFNSSFTNGVSHVADTSLNDSLSLRQRREAPVDNDRIDRMENLITKMMETLTVRFDRVEDKISLIEDKIGQIEDQINKKQDANVDAAGLDDYLNMDDELQAQNFITNSTMFPNYGQQRIHTPNQMLPQMMPGVGAQQSMLNPYGNQYYNNVYPMGMNHAQYQASLMTSQRTPLLMAQQQNPYADMTYNTPLPDPRNNLHSLLAQQPAVQTQGTAITTLQTSTASTLPPIQTAPPQQVTPVLPTLPTANTVVEKTQQNVARTWNTTFNNTPIEKGPPVNVVITNSEPLPSLQTTTVTSQPALSVTIPSHHIKNTTTSNDPPAVSFTMNLPSAATAAAPPVIDFSKKEPLKTAINPLSSTVIGSSDKEKDSKTTKPSPFANFSFGNLSSNTTGGATNLFSSLVKPAEPAAPKPAQTTETETSVANTSGSKDDDDEYVPTAEFKPVIELPDLVELKTGEEDETVKFEYRAKLLRYVKDSKEWKERGVGNMKVLVNKNDPSKVRLVMRREQIGKLCCNQLIAKDTKFTKLPNLNTALSWYGHDFSENELTTELLAVRFKTAETCTEFLNAILDAQKNMTGGTVETTSSVVSKSSVKDNKKEETSKQGFGDQFKPQPGAWECKLCYISNKASDIYCVACESPKDDTVPKKEPKNLLSSTSSSTTKFSFGVPFAAPKDKPAAKETPAPVAAKAPVGKEDNGFGDKFKPQPGAWECKLCYISNKASDIYCVACELPKDDTVPKKEPKNLLSSMSSSTTKFSFGVPFGAANGNNNAAATAPAPATTSASPFSFGAFTAMTTNNSVSSTPAAGATLGQPKPGGFTFASAGLNTNSPFAVTPSIDSTPKKDLTVKELTTKLEQKENFSFVFKPKSPGKVKSPLKADGVEDVSDDENIEEENNTYFTPVIPLPDKVEVKTGEENEEVLYIHRAKLFRFAEGEWKERGLGDVKILRHTETKKLRVVMRREQIHKICLNHVLNDEVEYKVKDDKSWHFIVNDFSENEVELMQFCLRFKTPEIASEFRQALRDALAGTATSQAPNGNVSDDNLSQEEKNNIFQLKLPSGFYSHGADCTGCRGCKSDEFVFENPKDINSDIVDDNPLPLKQPTKQFSKTPAKPSLTTFGQLSKTSEASKNIFGSANNSSSSQGLFTQLSFTPNTKESPSIFGSSNIFGGNKSTTFAKTNDEPKITTSADDVKKSFSFTNTLKPSVFGQNIFGQATTAPSVNAAFGTTPIKTTETAAKSFSFGEALRTAATNSQSATTPTSNLFSFAKTGNGDDSNNSTTTNSTSSEQNIFGTAAKGAPLFGSSLNTTNSFGSTKFSFASPSTSNNNADAAPLRDNGLSFAALAKSNDSGTATTESPFKTDSSLSFASLASQSAQSFTSPAQGDSKQGFFGLSNENAFSNFQKPTATANDSAKDDSNVDDANYDPHYDPIIPLPDEIVVRTGEEEEEKLFGERSKLYRYDATNKEWKERGVGEFKILYHPVNDTYRFLLRREQIHKCVLNHQLSADLSVNPMKSSEKAFAWAAHNHGEDSNGDLEQLSVRFKNPEIATKFHSVVQTCINKLKAKGDGLEPEDD